MIEDYKTVDGAALGERNPKWLQDDYVKFIRFAQWRIEEVKPNYGILAYITNHSYLDNPTFRGMRQKLLNSFDEIHVYNLHGASKKKEVAPDGNKDENVFDIQQGCRHSIGGTKAGTRWLLSGLPCRPLGRQNLEVRYAQHVGHNCDGVGAAESGKVLITCLCQ